MIKYLVFLATNILFCVIGYRWFQSNVSYPVLIDNLQHLNVTAIIISSIPYGLLLLAYTIRTGILIKRPITTAFVVTIMGHGFNNICPFRLGELLRIILARRFYNISAYYLGLTVILEKSFDLIAVCLLAILVIYTLGSFGGTWVLIALLFTAILAINFIMREFDFTKWFKEDFFLVKYLVRLHAAVQGCELKKKIIPVSVLSLLIWLLSTAQFYLYFTLQLPHANISVYDALAMVVITAVAFVMPVTIGSIGVFEGVIIIFLQKHYNLTAEHALVLAGTLHLVISVPQILGTVLCVLFKESERLITSCPAINRER